MLDWQAFARQEFGISPSETAFASSNSQFPMTSRSADLESGVFGDNGFMPSAEPKSDEESRTAPTPGPGDFYYEGPYLVFTEQYHLRRGWCCQSGCRHCPYGFVKRELAPASEPDPGPEQN